MHGLKLIHRGATRTGILVTTDFLGAGSIFICVLACCAKMGYALAIDVWVMIHIISDTDLKALLLLLGFLILF